MRHCLLVLMSVTRKVCYFVVEVCCWNTWQKFVDEFIQTRFWAILIEESIVPVEGSIERALYLILSSFWTTWCSRRDFFLFSIYYYSTISLCTLFWHTSLIKFELKVGKRCWNLVGSWSSTYLFRWYSLFYLVGKHNLYPKFSAKFIRAILWKFEALPCSFTKKLGARQILIGMSNITGQKTE